MGTAVLKKDRVFRVWSQRVRCLACYIPAYGYTATAPYVRTYPVALVLCCTAAVRT